MNCLASTGENVIVIYGVVALLFALAAFSFYKKEASFLMVGMVLAMAFSPVTAFAAESCGATLAADTTSGAQGVAQTINVLKNDTPTPGSAFVLGSLILLMPLSPVEGSVLSPDSRSLTVPSEGTYVAGTDGIITFTPEPSFVGTAHGVRYSIEDTSGAVSISTYVPVVAQGAPGPVVCTPVTLPIEMSLDGLAWSDGGGIYYVASNVATSTVVGAGDQALKQYIDIDVTTPGVQTTIDHSQDEGWTAVYDPVTDIYTFTITDISLYAPLYVTGLPSIPTLSYQLDGVVYCSSQPTLISAPSQIFT